MKTTPQSRFAMILLVVVLMVALVFILGQSLQQGGGDALSNLQTHEPESQVQKSVPPIRSESGVFQAVDQASRFQDTTTRSRRLLDDYYARRAYLGAPPFIPHPIEATMDTSFESCLGCHEKGGFAPQFNAYTPVTPHPEFTNCRQCHVPQSGASLFAELDWQKQAPPALGRAALPGGPPPIPHTLQLRETCSACHSGPAAPPSIRTSHPERLNCRQCHVPTENQTTFLRAATKEPPP